MSTCHDDYVACKTQGSYIRRNNRVEMIKLAVADSNWIECDEWQCKQNDFIDFPQVCQEFSKEINSEQFKTKIYNYIGNNKIRLPKVSVFYVCGRDHCDKLGLWDGVREGYNGLLVAKTLVVPRPDASNYNNHKNKNSKNCIVVNVPESKMIDDRSSRQISIE